MHCLFCNGKMECEGIQAPGYEIGINRYKERLIQRLEQEKLVASGQIPYGNSYNQALDTAITIIREETT